MSRKKHQNRRVGEPARELETYRLASSLISDCAFDHDGLPIIPRDTTLAAFAQLGACQTSTARCLISIFDAKYQYFIAESTPTTPLIVDESDSRDRAEDLWLGGTAIPREHGICGIVLAESPSRDAPKRNTPDDDDNQLPLTMTPNLTTDPRFKDKPFCKKYPSAQFYAAVPIQTARGINIGVFCVVHTSPMEETWTQRHTSVMRDTSRAIMRYLEAHQASASHRRNERMNRGVGSFMEKKSTISGWQQGHHSSAYTDVPNREGALNREQQDSEHMRNRQRQLLPSPSVQGSESNNKLPDYPENSQEAIEIVFSRAANIIREAVEIEGCIFTDASFYGRETSTSSARGQTLAQPLSPTPRSSDEEVDKSQAQGHRGNNNQLKKCRVLGFSTSEASSVNRKAASHHHTQIPEQFLAKLLRRYPEGKVFSFDRNGDMHTSDSSSTDDGQDITPGSPRADPIESQRPPPLNLPKDQQWSRQREGITILQAFPGARSVAFVPVREPGKKALYAGSFIYTRTPTRLFTIESELSYLRAFSTLAAVEIIHSKLVLEDRAKADALSSLSHELRSPLHGIILGAELLQETDLTVVQGDVVHTLETCGRTLSDTLDHLLDFTKINQYKLGKRKQQQKERQQQQQEGEASSPVQSPSVPAVQENEVSRAGVQSLSSVVHLDLLVEEVIESVFAGYTFQQLSAAGVSVARGDNLYIDQMEKRRAEEDAISNSPSHVDASSPFKNVLILVAIDPTLRWLFFTQPGAVRRVVMNLFANALKYTSHGAIHVSLGQKMVGTENHVVLTVSDTGSGIGKDFLADGLFQPFSQENFLLPGTGLGLSIVKRTVAQLNGHVSIQSSAGVGTTAVASLPLARHWASLEDEPGDYQADDQVKLSLDNERAELGGLRVFLKGFNEHELANSQPPGAQPTGPTGYPAIKHICEDWLRLTVVEKSQINYYAPDLVLYTQDEFDKTSHTDPTLNTPCVVVCPNSFISQDRFLRRSRHGRIVEYISQPLGPHKLAKMLLLAFRKWADARPGSSSVTSSSPPSSPVISAHQFPMKPTGSAPSSPPSHKPQLPEASASPAEKDAGQKPGPEPGTKSPTRCDRVEFLLVDDNKINLKLLSAVMKKLRQKFSTVYDGKAAVDWYTNAPGRCKCIIMDVSMPVMDGFDATRHIRGHESSNKLEPTIIIGLSGLASAEARAEALQCGMNLFQTKPIDFRKIKALLESHDLLT